MGLPIGFDYPMDLPIGLESFCWSACKARLPAGLESLLDYPMGLPIGLD